MMRWMIILLIAVMAGMALAGCGGSPEAAAEVAPAVVEALVGTEFNRVTLSEQAAARLGIETAPLREEVVMRARTVAGQVEALQGAANPGVVRVRVPLNDALIQEVARDQPAVVMSFDDEDDTDDGDEGGLMGEVIDADDINDAPDDADEDDPALYYEVDNTSQALAPGDQVRVKLAMTGSGVQSKVVPYAAIIYGLNGETWVYVNPEPLVFHREPVTVSYVDGDTAVLSEGPAVGAQVVTVGVAELYGADTGVGK
jgi:hypothetical protein